MIAGSLIAAFLIARLIMLFRFQVFTSYDTSSYIRNRAGGGGLLAHPVSLTGQAPRLWGVPLFYSLLPTDHARAVAQWVIGTVAWSVLGVGLWMHMRSVTAKSIVLAATFTLALTPSVARRDYSLLSESLSISLGVLAGGLFAIWVKKGSFLALGGMTLVAFWWMFTRQDVVLFAALLALVVAVYGLRHRGRVAGPSPPRSCWRWGSGGTRRSCPGSIARTRPGGRGSVSVRRRRCTASASWS